MAYARVVNETGRELKKNYYRNRRISTFCCFFYIFHDVLFTSIANKLIAYLRFKKKTKNNERVLVLNFINESDFSKRKICFVFIGPPLCWDFIARCENVKKRSGSRNLIEQTSTDGSSGTRKLTVRQTTLLLNSQLP